MRYLPPWLRVQIFVGFTLKANLISSKHLIQVHFEILSRPVEDMASHSVLTKYIAWSKSCQSLHSLESQIGLFSSASVVPQSKSTELCGSKILALCYLFGKTWPAYSSATRATESNTQWPNYWKCYWREPHTHSTESFDDSLETCEIERCSVSEPVFKHNHCAPAFTTKMWSWVVL